MRLLTFGGLRLEGSDFRSEQPLLILSYIAVKGSVSRAELMELFWPFQADNTKRVKSLSDCLNRLDKAGIEALSKRGSMLTCTLNADFTELETCYQLGDFVGVSNLYQGSFLDRVETSQRWQLGEDLEDWLWQQRQRYQSLFIAATLSLLEKHLETPKAKNMGVMTALIRRLLGLPFSVQALSAGDLSRLELILNASGIKGFDSEIKHLRQELAEPLVTDLLGRQTQVAELLRLSLTHRFVLLYGLAGVGKTTVLEHLRGHFVRFFDSVEIFYFRQLDRASSLTDLLAVFSEYFARTFDSKELLFHYLGRKKSLFLLDNLEHLNQFADFWQELLAGCPHLHIFATSRSKLSGFSVLHVELEPLDKDAAFMLLELELRRLGLYQKHAKSDKEALLASLGYLPLAIKLIAPWFKVMPLSQIMVKLTQGLDLLKQDALSFPALIRDSVAQLPKEGKQLFYDLAVFKGGFDYTALTHIVSLQETSLRLLVETSLLGFSATTERYTFHPLIERFLATETPRSTNAHAAYYLQLLGSKQSRQKLTPDLQNLSSAWENQCQTKPQLLLEWVGKLRLLADEFSLHSYCLRLAQALFEHFPSSPKPLLALAWLKLRLANYAEVEGLAQKALDLSQQASDRILALNALGASSDLKADFEKAQGYFEAALSLADSSDEKRSALLNLTVSCLNQGQLEQAEYYLHSLPAGSSLRKDYLHAWLRLLQGNYVAAKLAFELLIGQAQKQEQEHMVFQVKPKIVRAMLGLNETNQALELCQTSLSKAREQGMFRSEIALGTALGDCYLALKKYSEAFSAYLQALSLSRTSASVTGLLGLFVRLIASYKLEQDFSQQLLGYCQKKTSYLLYEDSCLLTTLILPNKENSDALMHLNELELSDLILLRYQA